MKIGIVDSGLGGIFVLKHLLNSRKYAHYIFYGDYLHNPYGNKTITQLKQYYNEAIKFLKSKECDKIVIACNTLSIVNDNLNIITPIKYVQKKINNEQKKYQILLATNFTVNSDIYKTFGISCNNFVPYLEENIQQDKLKLIDTYLNSYKKAKNVIILGCTHYNYFKNDIKKYYNKKCVLIDSCCELAKAIKPIKENLFIEIYLNKIELNTLKNLQLILKKFDYEIKSLNNEILYKYFVPNLTI